MAVIARLEWTEQKGQPNGQNGTVAEMRTISLSNLM
jgi:hypothetical protein